MGDIQSMKWAVWDPRSQQEMGEWDQPVKPSYLKLELVRKDGARSLTNVGIFWIPTGLGPGGQSPADAITKTALATTNTGTNSP
jgi:hypothetical protein